jgi:hypothetical protein
MSINAIGCATAMPAGNGDIGTEVAELALTSSSDQEKRTADDAKDDAKDAHDAAAKAIDFLRDYETTEAQTSAAALHRA